MPSAVTRTVVAAAVAGGVLAGVATASAAPLQKGSSVSVPASEEQQLRSTIAGLQSEEHVLQSRLHAAHRARGTAPAATGATATEPVGAVVTGEPAEPPAPHGPSTTEPTTEPTTAPTGVVTEPTTEPTTDTDGEPTTEPTEPSTTVPPTTTTTTTTVAPTTTTTTRPRHGGDGGGSDD